jgi:hypothetical protein
LSKKRIKAFIKPNSSGRDSYVKVRSTVVMSKKISSLNYKIKELNKKLKIKEEVINAQVVVLDDYRLTISNYEC